MFAFFHRWSWFRKAVALVLLLGVGIVAYSFFVSWRRDQRVAAELERLRANGIPTNAKELNDFVAIPAGEFDTTFVWSKPIAMIERGAIGRHPYGFPVLDESFRLLPPPREPWPDLERAKVYLAQHRSLMDAIDTAVDSRGPCCFISDYSAGVDILLPHVQYGRMVVKLLKLRTYVHAHEASAQAAANDLVAMLQTLRLTRDEPIQVSQECHRAYLDEVLPLLEQMLPYIADEQEELIEIQKLLEQVDTHRGLKLAAIGDRVMGLSAFDDPASAGAVGVPTRLYSAWIGDNECELLDTMRELDQAIGKAWPEPLALAGFYGDVGWEETQVSAPLGRSTWYVPTTFAKNLSNSVVHFANTQARTNAAVAGIAAVRFHADHAQWPMSLAELIPDYIDRVPPDPFTGEALKLVQDSGELRIYSVGPNRQDDGGEELIGRDDDGDPLYDGSPDVVFRIPLDGILEPSTKP